MPGSEGGANRRVEEKGLTTAQAETADALVEEVDFAANEPMLPGARQLEVLTQQLDATRIIGSAQKDDTSPFWLERFTERTSWLAQYVVVGDSMRLAMCSNEMVRGALKMLIRTKTEAPTDSVLPAPLEGFDFGLEAGLSRWSENRRHSEAKTAMNKPAKAAHVAMRGLKGGVIIKLHINGTAVFQPVLLQGVEAGAKCRPMRQDRAHSEAASQSTSRGISRPSRISSATYASTQSAPSIHRIPSLSLCFKSGWFIHITRYYQNNEIVLN